MARFKPKGPKTEGSRQSAGWRAYEALRQRALLNRQNMEPGEFKAWLHDWFMPRKNAVMEFIAVAKEESKRGIYTDDNGEHKPTPWAIDLDADFTEEDDTPGP
jgi:hypothetical protein